MALNTFPSRPFDGQLFADRYNVWWRFNIEERCWRRAGTSPSIPLASSSQSGLLSAHLKTLVDSVPEKGGHFGIVVKPFLSTVPLCPEKLLEGTVETITVIPSGTAVKVIEEIPGEDGTGTSGVDWSGMVLRFEKGELRGQQFIIYAVEGRTIKVLGDASLAENGDTLGVLEPQEADRVGLITGDIELTSDSLDISCITGEDGDIIEAECAEPIKFPDNLDNPPGFDIRVGEKFLDTFCIQVPGCAGPRGEQGGAGNKGIDGTGDGPRGTKGATGDDATASHKFTGVKIIESDEVFDTAVVSLELDSEAGKLTAIKAKAKTPTEEDAAEQLITTPVHRGVQWSCFDLDECISPNLDVDDFSEAFEYGLAAPPDDPLGVLDVTLGYYAKGVMIGSDPAELNTSRTKLGVLIDKVIDYYVDQLNKTEAKWNTQAKEFMTAKDREARQILSMLILKLAECEWELPIEMCVGIKPDDCHPGPTGAVQEEDLARMPMAGFLLGEPFCEDSLAEWLGDYKVPAGTGVDTPGIRVQYPSNTPMGSETLPEGGYVIQYLRGAYYDSNHPDYGYFVGNPECDNCGDVSGIGLMASYDVEGPGPAQEEFMPPSTAPHDKYDMTSVESAYQDGPLLDKVITPVFTGTGIITLTSPTGPNASATGEVTVRVLRVFPCTGTGFRDLDDYSPDELGQRDEDPGTVVEAES